MASQDASSRFRQVPADGKLRPEHYRRGCIEVIDYIEDQGLSFNLGNVVKYVSRAGFKSGEGKHTDLGKAMYYLRREIENVAANKPYRIFTSDESTND